MAKFLIAFEKRVRSKYHLVIKIGICKFIMSDFEIFFFFSKYFLFMLYRLSRLILRNFEGKVYPFGIMCFSLLALDK